MDTQLKKATEIFESLGWLSANSENIMDLPLGTPEQKKIALAGLKSGAWSEYSSETVGGITKGKQHLYFALDYANKLALFAVRVGITATRATQIVNIHQTNKEALFKVVEGRGKKFASDYITQITRFGGIRFEDAESELGNVNFFMRLVNELEIEIPQNVNYINVWTLTASEAMGGVRKFNRNIKTRPGLDLIQPRFMEHIMAGITLNAPASNGFATVLATGVKYGFIPREEAMELCLTALDASVRPGDRAAWLDALDLLEIRDEELLQHIQSLIPLLSLGDAKVIERLAPALITQSADSLLTEVLLSAFSAPTKKAKLMLLKTAIKRQAPENVEEIAPWISIFAGDSNKSISAAAEKLASKWNIGVETFPEEEIAISGLWNKTPTLWQVPNFELGEVSPEALTELAVEINARSSDGAVYDVAMERFYALINAIALQNPDDARTSLRGLNKNEWRMREIICWVHGEESYGSDEANANRYRGSENKPRPPIPARNYVVAQNFGKLPYLLSTPSKVDLTITAKDLVKRLEAYANEKIAPQEADLYVAITRLDPKTVTLETRSSLEKLNIPVLLQSGETMSLTAGQAILNYLDNPIEEPPLEVYSNSYWRGKPFNDVSKSLGAFPERLTNIPYSDLSSLFPLFGDAVLEVKLDGYGDSEKVPRLPQAARRAQPLPPKASIDMLASLGYAKIQVADDVIGAIKKAWERGLLRPGIADIKYLGRPKTPPQNLVSLASAFGAIAQSGILSVVWPIMDEIIGASLAAPRLLPGTAEFCELMTTFLPEVKLAIEKNLADKTALDLPNTRTLAKQKGSSRAVTSARKIAEQLPVAQDTTPIPIKLTPSFDEAWPKQSTPREVLEDGVTMTVEWSNDEKKYLLFRLNLPAKEWQEYHVESNAYNDFGKYVGFVRAYPAQIGAPFVRDYHNQVRLVWDTKSKTLVVKEREKWNELHDLAKGATEIKLPLSLSVITIVIGLIAQDGDSIYSTTRTVRDLIETGQLHPEVTRKAIITLLQNPAVNPAKLTRLLEKDINLLPTMYPILTQCIKAAGAIIKEEINPPTWLNRILDTALRYAPYLKEATKRNRLSPQEQEWQGLAEIANTKSKSTAIAKAKKLLTIINEE
ncbi:MAG: DUF6493 family protein [Defluviitaleaceae bacterium]|nr:DUF6493 family protein [Defluviitaleaceae bacterium]